VESAVEDIAKVGRSVGGDIERVGRYQYRDGRRRDDGHEEPEPTVIDPTSVVIMLDVTEVPPRALYDGKSMMLTVHHGSRVTVSLDRDTGQILSVVTFGPEPTDNVQTEYPTQKEQ
jgi:hypothetical protein